MLCCDLTKLIILDEKQQLVISVALVTKSDLRYEVRYTLTKTT